MSDADGDVTRLLTLVRAGDQEAENQLIPLIYDELRRMAGAYMRGERPGHTLQATALVNEAYMRLAGGQAARWENRAHFFAIAAHTMREVLVDHARRHRAGKRGGDARRVEMPDELSIVAEKLEDVLAIDQALQRLAQLDPRQCRLVELRFFAGLNVQEVGAIMGISEKTVKREWRSAKAWLHRELAAVRSV